MVPVGPPNDMADTALSSYAPADSYPPSGHCQSIFRMLSNNNSLCQNYSNFNTMYKIHVISYVIYIGRIM